jgi:hypothetical protein
VHSVVGDSDSEDSGRWYVAAESCPLVVEE